MDKQGKRIYADPITMQPVNTGFETYNQQDPMTALLQGLVGNQGGQQQEIDPGTGLPIQYDEQGRPYVER